MSLIFCLAFALSCQLKPDPKAKFSSATPTAITKPLTTTISAGTPVSLKDVLASRLRGSPLQDAISRIPTDSPCQTHTISPQTILPSTYSRYEPFAWSPMTDTLAYVNEDSLWLVSGPTYRPYRLVQIPYSHLGQVLWSPDGHYIAFGGGVSMTYNTIVGGISTTIESPYFQRSAIWVVKDDGQRLSDLLLRDEELGRYYKTIRLDHWLDEQHLAFVPWLGTGTQSLWLADLERDTLTPVIDSNYDGQAHGGSYHWSPSTTRLIINHAFWGNLVLTSVLSKTDVVPTSERWLSQLGEPPFQMFIDWHPQEEFFLYTQSDLSDQVYNGLYDHSPDLWRWNIAQQQGQKLLPHILQASLSPDGTQVAFLEQLPQTYDPPRLNPPPYFWYNSPQPDPLPLDQQPSRLRLGKLDLHTGAVQYYGPGGYRPSEGPSWWRGGRPVWSPDGQMIAYWNEAGQVWVVSVDGAWQQCLRAEADVVQVSWSFDSRKLALQLLDRFVIVALPLRLE